MILYLPRSRAIFRTDELLDFRVWSPEEKEKGSPCAARRVFSGNASKISAEWQAATEGKATGINVRGKSIASAEAPQG